MTLRPYQTEAIQAVEQAFTEVGSCLIVLATGCHAVGSKVMSADGRSVNVESVHVGDRLLGMDGTPRTVLAVHKGNKPCCRIVPNKGDPFGVTEDHVLTLVRTAKSASPKYASERGGKLVNATVRTWQSWSKTKKHLHKLLRASAIEFPCEKSALPIPPYILGVLLGDGGMKYSSINVTTMEPEVLAELREYAEANGWTLRAEQAGAAKCWIFQTGELGCKGSALHDALKDLGLRHHGSGEKFIPQAYKTASISDRLELLAGLVDTDGCENCNTYDFTTKSKALADDIAFVCRSLGLAAYPKKCEKSIKSLDFTGEYWRMSISGDTSVIPCRVERRKCQKRTFVKSVLRTGFTVEPVGNLDYVGFTVDGDNRYLLDDFTITHNCGKTIIFSHLAAREVKRGGRVLILAHRGELLQQAIDKLHAATGIVAGLEKAEETSDVDIDEPPHTVVVGSVQSMKSQKRLARFAKDDFSLIVIDECHHALTDTYRAVIDHFPDARLLGVTATPDRGDLRSLGEVFQKIAYEYSIVDAIRDGYLCPIRAQTVPLRIDLTGVAKQGGDYQAAGLGSALAPYLRQICREIKERCADRKTIVFTPLIATSRKMLDLFAEQGVSAASVREVNGESPDRAEILDWFAHAPKGSVLLNSMLLTEGYDEPSVDCICVLRATKVRALFVQMVGRGTRLSPETGKQNLLLLDFLWMTQTHDLCRPACLLTDDEEVAATITEKQEKSCGEGDLEIDPETLEAAESETVQKREKALADRLEKMRRRKAGLVDPLQYAYSVQDVNLTHYTPMTDRDAASPTMEQLDRLEKLGFGAPQTFGEAELLVKQHDERRAAGLSTPKQIRFLESKGFRNVAKWTKAQAQKMTQRIIVCNWRVPAGVNPETYSP